MSEDEVHLVFEIFQAENISIFVTQIHQYITATLRIHLNIGQHLSINASSVYFTIETVLKGSLANHSIDEYTNAAIYFPTEFNISQSSSDRIYIRVSIIGYFVFVRLSMRIVLTDQLIVQPLAPMGNSSFDDIHISASKILELSLIDPDGNEVEINALESDPIELFIPRDVDAIQSILKWNNVSASNKTNRTCDFHQVNITKDPNVTVAIHFEIHPSNESTGYAMVYRFADFPHLISTFGLNNRQELLCPQGQSIILLVFVIL